MEERNSNRAVSTSGVGFVGLLTIVFIVLKLTNVIRWNWAWVLSPLWIPLAVVFVIVIVGLAVQGIASLVRNRRRRENKNENHRD